MVWSRPPPIFQSEVVLYRYTVQLIWVIESRSSRSTSQENNFPPTTLFASDITVCIFYQISCVAITPACRQAGSSVANCDDMTNRNTVSVYGHDISTDVRSVRKGLACQLRLSNVYLPPLSASEQETGRTAGARRSWTLCCRRPWLPGTGLGWEGRSRSGPILAGDQTHTPIKAFVVGMPKAKEYSFRKHVSYRNVWNPWSC